MNRLFNLKRIQRKAVMPRIFKRFQKDETGATAIEFAFVGPPFILLLFAIIETSVFFLANQYLETVIDDVTRLYRTGQLGDPATPDVLDLRTQEGFKKELCRRIVVMFKCEDIKTQVVVADSFSTLDELPPVEIDDDTKEFITPEAFPPEVCPLQVLQLTAQYLWPVFTNYTAERFTNAGVVDKALISVTAAVRTEDFPVDTNTSTC